MNSGKHIIWLAGGGIIILLIILTAYKKFSLQKIKYILYLLLLDLLGIISILIFHIKQENAKFKHHFEPFQHQKIEIISAYKKNKITGKIFIDKQKYDLNEAYHFIVKDTLNGIFKIIHFKTGQTKNLMDSIQKYYKNPFFLIANERPVSISGLKKWKISGFDKLLSLNKEEVYVAYSYHSFVVELIDLDSIHLNFPSNFKILRSRQELLNQTNDVNRFIAHAGGMINNDTYTNSLEALNNSYRNGFRLFELDIQKTADNIYVAEHKWQEWDSVHNRPAGYIPNLKEFLQEKTLNKYTPLSIKEINQWFKQHPDAVLITDKINTPGDFASKFIDKNRLLMEVFSFDAIKDADKNQITVMPNWDLFLNKTDDEIIKLTKQYKIKYLTASRRQIKTYKNIFLKLKKNGIKIYFFHVNRNKFIDEKYVFLNELDYGYGMYADKWNFNK